MSQIYTVEVLIVATAAIRANSPEEAAKIAEDNFSHANDASVSTRTVFGDVDVSGDRWASEDLPDVSLSPAMTFAGSAAKLDAGDYGLFTVAGLDCVHDDADEEDGE